MRSIVWIILVLTFAVILGVTTMSIADIGRRGDPFKAGGEGGTIVNQTIQYLTTETITIEHTVEPNLIWDVLTAGDTDWWDAVVADGGGKNDDKKKGGTGTTPDADVVYYWDVNGVYWTLTSANPDVTVQGERQWDNDDYGWVSTDGTNDFYTSQKLKLFSMTIYDPDTLNGVDPNVPILPVEAEVFPGGITLLDVGIKTDVSSTYSVQFIDMNAPDDASPTAIETVATSSSLEAEDDGTLSSGTIAAGNIVYIILPATDIAYLQVWGTYYVNTND